MNARTKKILKRLGLATVAAAVIAVGVGVVNAQGAVKPDCKNLMYPLCPRSVAATQVVDNSLPKSKIVPADRDAFLKDTDTDNKGAVLLTKEFDAKAVATCGGSFKTGATKLGSFTLPAGKNLSLDAYMFASRTATGPVGTHAQLALRIGASDTSFGLDRGTVFQPLPPTKDREVTGTTFWVGNNDADVTVDVLGFCYNDDQGSAGSGDFTMASRVRVTQG
jgi:hypothetical protein